MVCASERYRMSLTSVDLQEPLTPVTAVSVPLFGRGPRPYGVLEVGARGRAMVLHYHGPFIRAGMRARLFMRLARRGVDRIVAISRFVAESLPKELHHKVRVVHNGVAAHRLRKPCCT